MSETIRYTADHLERMKEVLNVGLASATDILGKLLNQSLEIGADRAGHEELENLEVFGLIPAIAAHIEYIGAIQGKCSVIIRQSDVKHILNFLMNVSDSGEDAEDELELDEITFNTIRELFNQMTMAFGEAMSEFFGESVQVLTMDITIFENMSTIEEYFACSGETNVVNFTCHLGIPDIMSTCLCLVFDPSLATAIYEKVHAKTEPEPAPAPTPAPQPAATAPVPEAAPAAAAAVPPTPQMAPPQPGVTPVYPEPVAGAPAQTQPAAGEIYAAKFPNFGDPGILGSPLTRGNMDLLMDVPLNVTVEIGKTRRKMREIMDFTQGTVLSLEKQAGAPVDIVVNGQLLARGDVVVIDDNFGVRITEIVGMKDTGEKE